MSTEQHRFNWSDAWLLLAVTLASQRAPANIETIIKVGDEINFAIFKADELESGLVRLAEAGYIVESAGSFSITEKVKSQAATLLAEERSTHERLKDAQEFLRAAAAADDQPCRNNLKYPGFTKKQYEDAVERYQGYLR